MAAAAEMQAAAVAALVMSTQLMPLLLQAQLVVPHVVMVLLY